MKLFGTFNLIILSIIWLATILVLSGHDLQQLVLHPDIDKIDLQNFIEAGILPVTYLWMAFICFKILIPTRKNA